MMMSLRAVLQLFDAGTTREPDHATLEALAAVAWVVGSMLERLGSQEAFALLQRRLQRATERGTDGVWEWDLATGRMWVSDPCARLLGGVRLTHARALQEHLHPQDVVTGLEVLRGHTVHGKSCDMRFRFRMPSGQYRWFRARGGCSLDDQGMPRLLSGSIADVHEHHAVEQRLDLVLKATDLALWDVDYVGGHDFLSEGFRKLLGEETDGFVLRMDSWAPRVHPDDRSWVVNAIHDHKYGRAPRYDEEYRVLDKNGEWRWVRAIGEVVERDESGEPARFTGVLLDIQAVREDQERAEAANRAKSAFLANMSHEIRTPLTAILGYVDLLEHPDSLGQGAPTLGEVVQTVRRNAHHLLHVINDILDVSKIEAGRMTVEQIDTDLQDVIDDVAALMRPHAEEKGVRLEVEIAESVPRTIVTDPTRLRQIVLNLCSNAVKFTEEGQVSIRVSAVERVLVIEVEDTGEGMTPQQCALIQRFDAFVQADSSTTRRHGGTGLGLRISHGLARMLGGGIEVRSELGQGSCFTARVHLRRSSAAVRRGRPEALDGANLAGARILLVEDGVDNQRLLQLLLRRAGAEVALAPDGLRAVEYVLQASEDEIPEVVLMDMQMPVLDGYGATRRLRREGFTELPIVALTAHAMADDRQRCLDAGCDDFLTKPVDHKQLIRTCAAWLARRAPESV